MRKIDLEINGEDGVPEWEQAVAAAEEIARQGNPETMMIARCNRLTNSCSPCALGGDLGGRPGWEVYGETHGGRLKIVVNGGIYTFIFT